MYWADELIEKLPKDKHHRVDDMKTPSGHAHAGSLRAISTHGLVYEAMKKAGYDVHFSYVVNDMDPMDGLPRYLDENEYGQHMGKPLNTIPAPDGQSENYAVQFATEYINAFNTIGFKPEILWSSNLYKAGEIDPYIKLALDNVEEIRKIYKEVAGQKKPEGWYPFQVICPNCGKIGSSLVTDWDGEMVTYECKLDMVEWAKGCGHKGKISPFGGTGKLMWKVDWPAHWSALNITVEGAGKDHFSAGGSRYIGMEIMPRIFGREAPFGFLHEFLLIGGAKMSSSKGNATTAAEFVQLLPAEVGRFLFVRTPYQRAINFDPMVSNTIPDLFDEYDRCAKEWFDSRDKTDRGRMFEAAQINEPPATELFLPRFRQVAMLIQMREVDQLGFFAQEKGAVLSDTERKILEERIKYAQLWLDKFAGEEDKFELKPELPESARNLSIAQKEFLIKLAELLESKQFTSADELQQEIYELGKSLSLAGKETFAAIYLSLLGKNHGPKAGLLILQEFKMNQEFILKRFREVNNSSQAHETKYQFNILNKPERFTISSEVKTKWPSAIVGYAEIRGVKITKENSELEKLKEQYLAEFKNISREELNNFPELVSYRRMYKEMGIDWHSRRPSPEALLRRLTQGKDLYRVNTCVDAYNLVVMKNRVSVGAFDLKNIKFPTSLMQAQGGEKIILLMDQEATELKPGEVYYADQEGPYNLDFNYRDADRTKVTLDTTDLLINIDGVYDVDRKKIEKTLQETLDLITRFCGGEIIEAGIAE